tara:strand:- start:1029 stop:2459 length:1431 start_codon:yes stop_codon:yes gene_type:complete
MPLILGTNSIKDTGFNVSNSLRFNRASSDTLTKTFGSNGNNDKFTFSAWVKRSEVGVEHRIFSSHNTGSPAGYASMHFHTSDDLILYNYNGNDFIDFLRTDRKFRDTSAWYHIVLAYDTGQGTAANRVKLYINGVQETSFSTATYPSQNTDLYFNDNVIHYVSGGDDANGSNPLHGYMSEVCLVDNAQLAADSFGEFDSDSGIWKPKDVSGLTFGNTGFYLQFKESGTSANSSGMGADTSGNTNHFTVNNLTGIDQSIDTCTNNFATMNPLHSGDVTFAEGNLQVSRSGGSGWLNALSSFAPSSGKWYVEVKLNSLGSNGLNIGFANFNLSNLQNVTTAPGEDATSAGLYSNNGPIFYASGTTFATTGTPGGIVQLAMDLDNGYLYWGDDNTYLNSGNPASGSSGTGGLALSNLSTGGSYGIAVAVRNGGDVSFNFGSPPFSISSGNTDGDGFGNFEYAPPSGYFALCTKNLAEYG